MDKYQEKALESWYKEGDKLRMDLLHPLLGLAGESGELLDLYKKNEFKVNFSWWRCKICNFMPADKKRSDVDYFAFTCMNGKTHVPLILDELGDFWYYLRIVTWIKDINIEEYLKVVQFSVEDDILWCLNKINRLSGMQLTDYLKNGRVNNSDLLSILGWLMRLLLLLGCSLDELTEMNYKKLSGPDQHGWASDRRG